MVPKRDELQRTLQGVRTSIANNFGSTSSPRVQFAQPRNNTSVYKQVTNSLSGGQRNMPSTAELMQVNQQAARAANMRKIDQFGVEGEFGTRVKQLAREIESGQKQFGGLRGEVNLDQAGIKLDPQVRELYTREDVPQSVKDAWTYLAIEQRAKELEGRTKAGGLQGFIAQLSGDVEQYDKLKNIMAEMSAGQNVTGGDVRNKDYAAQMRQAGQGVVFPASLVHAATGDVAGTREAGRVGTQFMDAATFGAPSWFAGKESATFTPETLGGKIAGGGLSAAGMLSSMQLLAPLTGGITARAGQAATAKLGTRGLTGLVARMTPGATNAAIVSGLRAPSSVNPETGQTDQSLGRFINPADRLQAAAVGGGRYMASTVLGGAIGEAANKAGASDIVRRVAQGIGGGSGDVAFARLRGVTDPGELVTEFGTGAAFGFFTGNQDYAETFGKQPGKATIQAVKSNIGKPTDLTQKFQEAEKVAPQGQEGNYAMNRIQSMPPGAERIAEMQKLVDTVPTSDPLRPAILKLASFEGVKPSAPQGDVLGATTPRKGVDTVLKQYQSDVLAGKDPARAYASAVKKMNTEFSANIPTKLPKGVASDISKEIDILDPVKTLKLEGQEAEQYARLQSSMTDAMKSELDVLRGERAGSSETQTIEKLQYQLPADYTAAKGQPTQKMGKNLYTLLNNKGYTRDKGAASVILSKLKGTWGGTPKELEQARAWSGQPASSRQKRALYAVLANKDFTIDTYNQVASKVLGVEPSKITQTSLADASGATAKQGQVIEKVASAIQNRTIPQDATARQVYETVKQNALNKLTSEQGAEFQKDYNDVYNYVNKSPVPEYNTKTLFDEAKKAGLPIKTVEAQKNETPLPERLTIDVENLVVNKDLKPEDLQGFGVKTTGELQNRFIAIDKLGDSARASIRRVLGSDGIGKLKVMEEVSPLFEKHGITDTKTMREAEVYLAQKRNANEASKGRKGATAIEYEKSGIMKLFGGKDKVEIPDKFIENPKYEAFAKDLDTYQKNLLEYSYKNGILSDESYKALIDYGDYVPFQRWLDDSTKPAGGRKEAPASVVNQNIVKKYKGSDKSIKSPIESIIQKTMQVEKLVQREKAARTVVESMKQIPAFEGLVERVEDTTGLKPEEYVSFLENGQKVSYKAPEEIVAAAKFLHPEQVSPLIRLLSKMSSPLRKGATSANIDFLFGTNIIKDQINAAVNSKYGYQPGVDYARGLKAMLGNTPEYKQFLASGGDVSFGTNTNEIVKGMVRAADPNKVSKFSSKIKEYVNPLKAISDVAEYSDTPTRVGLFMRAMENGANVDQAMLQARGATADFSVKGANPLLSDITRTVPFMNAAIQGSTATYSALKQNPVKTSMKLAIYGLLPSLLSEAALSQTPVDDQISDYDRDKYFIIPIKGSESSTPDDFIRIPKPEFAQILNPLRYSMKDSNLSVTTVLAGLLSEASPVDLLDVDYEENRVDINPTSVVPMAIKPPIEILSNYDFFRKRALVPEYMKDLPTGYRAPSTVDPLFRQLGEAAPDTVNPAHWQHAFYSYTGGLGQQVADLVGRVTGAASQYPEKTRPGAPSSKGIPVWNRIGGVDLQTPEEQANARYYEEKDIKAQISAIAGSRAIPQSMKDAKLTELYDRLQGVYDEGGITKPETFLPYGER